MAGELGWKGDIGSADIGTASELEPEEDMLNNNFISERP